ncbi:MAG: hypothetical protein LUH45_05690, partial [Clostridiales bacterium]|nr:hypothetical protein [Clostridiales bacterium]
MVIVVVVVVVFFLPAVVIPKAVWKGAEKRPADDVLAPHARLAPFVLFILLFALFGVLRLRTFWAVFCISII